MLFIAYLSGQVMVDRAGLRRHSCHSHQMVVVIVALKKGHQMMSLKKGTSSVGGLEKGQRPVSGDDEGWTEVVSKKKKKPVP